jgi:hypothetical protein
MKSSGNPSVKFMLIAMSVLSALAGCKFGNDLKQGELSASGTAWAVNYNVTDPVKGAVVSILEYPGYYSITDEQGAYSFRGLKEGMELTFVLTHLKFTKIRTQTFTMGTDNLKDISFQAPSHLIFSGMCIMSETIPDLTKGHIASTITTLDPQAFINMGFPGEPGCTVTIEPAVPEECGPIYFNESTLPVRYLTETTRDGGICYVNVPPGEYTLYAHKDGIEFEPVKVKVAPMTLTNAAPAHGLKMVR